MGFDGDCYDDTDAPEQTVASHNGFPSPIRLGPSRSTAEIPYDGGDSACDGDALEFDADGTATRPPAIRTAELTGTDRQDCTAPCAAEPEWSGEVASADIYPGAAETWYDGVDQDCGAVDVNRDGIEDD